MLLVGFTEFVCTFVLISMLLGSHAGPVATVVSLAVVILLGSIFTTIYVNPAISLMCFLEGKLRPIEFALCILGQVCAVILAVLLYRSIRTRWGPA